MPTVPRVDLLAGHADFRRLLLAGSLSGLLVSTLLIGLLLGSSIAIYGAIARGPRWVLAAPFVIVFGLLFVTVWLAIYKRLLPRVVDLTLTEEIEHTVWHTLTLSQAMEVFRATSVKFDLESGTLTVGGDQRHCM